MNAMETLALSTTIALTVPAAYLIVLSIASLMPRRKTAPPSGAERPSIAVIIPAHNEEGLLGGTLDRIRETGYPEDRLQAFVIADNCTDRTAAIARGRGARVTERFAGPEEGRGKPFALKWFLENHRESLEGYDVIAIVDADTEVDPVFFDAIAGAMTDPEVQVVQGYYGTSNVEASWRAALSEVALCVSHHLRTLGRNAIGSTAGLKGNGMAFRSGVLLKNGWPAEALDEDLELSLILLEQGIRVRYLPEARIRAEMASDAEGATKQRLRWEGGRIELIWKYGRRLTRMLFTRRGGQAFETMLDLVTPPLVAYVTSLGLAALVTAALGLWLPAAIAAGALCAMVAMTLQAMLMRGAPKRCWLSLLEFPKFALWKLAVIARLFDPRTKILWLRTTRDHEAGIQTTRTPARGRARARLSLKRLLDIVGSFSALVLLTPLFAVTAMLIKLEDNGPVFFKQTRIGENGRRFGMWKFRSMYTDAEARKAALQARNQHAAGVTFKMKNDPRITRVGRVIRKFSIDEMPQFFNVLLGDMSLVGPRPPVPGEVAEYRSLELRRLTVKPGLSCLWQIEGRADIDFDGQVKLDLEYIHSATFLKDLSILFRTVPAVLTARGAY